MSSEIASFLTLGVCFLTLGVLLRVYGAAGIYAYYVSAILVSNLQLLRFAPFGFSKEPLALGTIVFSTTFLACDLLSEHYGPRAARQAIFLGFITQGFTTACFLLTLAHPTSSNLDPVMQLDQDALERVFTPSLRFLISSWFAFGSSQLLDIWVFQRLRKKFQGHHVWLRLNVSMLFAGILDHLVFSFCAWRWFTSTPLPLPVIFEGIVWGAIVLRVCTQIASTPFMYISYRLRP